MTLLTMCQKVAAKTGWPVPQSIASNTTDATAVQMLALAADALLELAREGDWPQLDVEFPFTTVIGQDMYELPDDAKYIKQNSAYDRSQYFGLKGSVGSQEWNARKYGMLANIWCTGFRVTYNVDDPTKIIIQLDSVPQEARDMIVSYISNDLVTESVLPGVFKNEFTLDNDTPRLPEELVQMGLEWSFRRAKGLDFSVELNKYVAAVLAERSKYLAQADIPIGRNPRWNTDWPLTQGYVPETGFGA